MELPERIHHYAGKRFGLMYIQKTYTHKIDEVSIRLEIYRKLPQDDNMQTGFIVLFGAIIIVIVLICMTFPLSIQEVFPFSLFPFSFLAILIIPVALILVGRHQRRHPKPPPCDRTIYTFDKRSRTLRVEKGPLVGESQEFDNRKYKMKEYPFEKIHTINLEASVYNNRIYIGTGIDLNCVHEGKDANEAANLHRELLRLKQYA